jgi:hypothetical protein
VTSTSLWSVRRPLPMSYVGNFVPGGAVARAASLEVARYSEVLARQPPRVVFKAFAFDTFGGLHASADDLLKRFAMPGLPGADSGRSRVVLGPQEVRVCCGPGGWQCSSGLWNFVRVPRAAGQNSGGWHPPSSPEIATFCAGYPLSPAEIVPGP